MKKVSLFILLCAFCNLHFAFLSHAQAPQAFKYQAIVHDNSGSIVLNQNVGLQISILAGSPGGSSVFTETHNVTTNQFGLANLEIGTGSLVWGNFAAINWGSGSYYIKIELDITGNTDYVYMGTSQLLSVPYALYAASGTPGPQGNPGQDAISIDWLGSLTSPPLTPTLNQAYYDSIQKISFIFDGTGWQILAQDGSSGPQGLQGPAGTGLNNKGSWIQGTEYTNGDYVFDMSSADTTMNTMWICEGNTFISNTHPYLDNANWVEFQAPQGIPGLQGTQGQAGVNGENGISIEWLGAFATAPVTPALNQAYYDSTQKKSLIFNGTGWQILAQDGSDGATGTPGLAGDDGTNGISIEWLGTLAAAPLTPALNQAYYDSIQKKSFVFDGTGWQILAQDGADGTAGIQGTPGLPGEQGPAGTYSAGAGISISNDTLINTSPDKTISLTGSGATSVSGTYPDFIISSTDGDTCLWTANGNDIYNNNYVNGKVGIGTNTPTGKLVVKGDSLAPVTEPLFEVKNKDGDPVFIVYPDSVRITFTQNAASKANAQGGFAVSGRSSSKGAISDYLLITPDSARIYLNESSAAKANAQGGFAVSGRSSSKGTSTDYLNVSVDTNETITPSQPRILWYPTKEAFLTGRVLIESSDSVGTNSFASGLESKASGDWSQALGYRCGARGDYSTAIGNFANANASNSFAFGDSAIATGKGSYAIGSVGRDTSGISTGIPTRAYGDYSFSIGLGTRTDSTNAFAFGNNTQAKGVSSTAFGYESIASGRYSIAGGFRCGANGRASIALGEEAIAGTNAVALGINAYAPDENAIAIGQFNFAESPGAVAIGYANDLQGSTYAFGDYNQSVAGIYGAYALGSSNLTYNSHTLALGNYNEVHNDYSVALGNNLLSSGVSSVAIGANNTASGNYSTSIGFGITTSGQYSIGIALGNQSSTTLAQNNAMAIMGGNVGIDNVTPYYKLDVVGDIRATGAVYANANGTMYFKGGDDSEIWDVNSPNTLAICGVWDNTIATLRLGTGAGGINEISGSGGNIGIGTSTPQAKLDVNGGIALRQTTLAQITAGPVANYNVGAGSYFRISSSATYAISGITGGVDGKIIILINIGANTINFNNESAGSNAANRFANSTGGQIGLISNGSITYIYDGVSQRWRDIAFRVGF